MRILFGMPEKTMRGGINACEPPLMAAIESRGVGVREIVTSHDHAGDESFRRRFADARRTVRDLLDELKGNTFNLVHLNSSLDRRSLIRDAYIVHHLSKKKARVFIKFHGSDLEMLDGAGFLVSRLARYLVTRAVGVGVLSMTESKALGDFLVPAEKVFLVKNVVEGPVFPHVEKQPDEPFRLVFASRLVPGKGLAETVEAVAMVVKKGHRVTLDVYGDGEERAFAEAYVEANGLKEIVKFHGHVSETNVARGYAKADMLVFPTFYNDGFPMVVFNAVRAGLPIITTRARAAADYLHDRENCMFCGAKNPESVARRIIEMIENNELREKIAANNRALASKFTADAVAPEYIEIYERLAAIA